MESEQVLHSRPFHRQKLHIVLSGMRHLADELGDRATVLRTSGYREALEQHGLQPPPGYGPPGAGNAVFSVSSFMDTLAPNDENADELMTAGAQA